MAAYRPHYSLSAVFWLPLPYPLSFLIVSLDPMKTLDFYILGNGIHPLNTFFRTACNTAGSPPSPFLMPSPSFFECFA
jgi:hypothetical protein